MGYIRAILRHWLPLALVSTIFAGLVYTVVQQVYRTSANDPQIQLAEDTAAALAAGQSPDAVIPTTKIDIARSLAPFVAIYDATGKSLASSGLLRNSPPSLPAGVFDYARGAGEDRITWQPEPGVRSATVVVAYNGPHPGFVLAGRSLREVENRIDALTLMIATGWIVTLVAALVAVAVCELIFADRIRTTAL